jgi:TatD DNase family protein
MMKMMDTHSHIYLPEFDADRGEMMQRMQDSGIFKVMMPNIDHSSIQPIKNLQQEFPHLVVSAMGLHPTSVKDDFENELALCYQELKSGNYVAVGEMGIDLYWDKTHFEQQKEAFRRQVNWALEFDLPLIIHSRDSFDEIFELMDELWNPALRGVFHCFSGKKHQAEKIVEDYKFLMGIGGVITFKNSGLAAEIGNIALEHLLLETDAPFLAPAPHRGKRNEPSYLTLIAQKLAETKNISPQKIAEITTQNALNLFNIKTQ